MSDAPQAQYFLLTTPVGRGQESAEKKKCTWHTEYFKHYTDKDGTWLLCSVNECEDKTMWFSKPMPFPVPQRAKPSTAKVYAAALARYDVVAAKKKAQADIDKAAKKKLAEMRSGLKALGLTPAPERSVASRAQLVERISEPVKVEQLLDKLAAQPMAVEASLPQPGLLDDFTVIDLEFQVNDMLELAAIRYRNWEPVGEVVSFVRFTGTLYRNITDLTGITALHLHDAPEERAVLEQFKKLAGDSLIVCHSVGADKRVLEAARTRQGAKKELPNPWLCTLALSKRRVKAGILPSAQKCGLGELCQHFKIKVRGAHRAKADVLMCFQLLRALHQHQPVTKADLHGAPQPGKSKKVLTPAGPGLFAAA
jgi:DNA polymerase-3 subunit epsilon